MEAETEYVIKEKIVTAILDSKQQDILYLRSPQVWVGSHPVR